MCLSRWPARLAWPPGSLALTGDPPRNQYLASRRTCLGPAGQGRRLVAGGLKNIDGAHASGCGYALPTSKPMNVPGLPHDPAALVQRAFADDTVLSQTPGEPVILVRLLKIYRELERLNHLVRTEQTFLNGSLHVGDALRAMQGVFTL